MPILKKNNLAPIALSCGDPASIATEITQKAWAQLRHHDCVFFVIGNHRSFDNACVITKPEEARECFSKALPVLELEPHLDDAHLDGAHLALASLEKAVDCVRDGSAGAIVTNPVNKARLAKIGFTFKGQTEYLANRAGKSALMMLANANMRCALVTTHLPLRQIAHELTIEKIVEAGLILLKALKEDFDIANPSIGIAALNPHCGDQGVIGDEEINIIRPACAQLARHGNVSQPIAADSLFRQTEFDCFLCMFHDQALIPIKMMGLAAVNISLGLPFIRTSPDHGTGFDIVGQNKANPQSLIDAIRMAHLLALKRLKQAGLEQARR